MAFHTELNGYVKTALSDLQGAWGNLRHNVVAPGPFPQFERRLFHIDEGMSWERVRDLSVMEKALPLVRNIAAQAKEVPNSIREDIESVQEAFEEARAQLRSG
jgi:hypothetical protein